MKKFATAYSDKKRVTTINNQVTMTKQNLAENANINQIIKKYQKTGIVPNMNALEAVYGEITSQDLQQANELLIKTHEAFMEVPSELRAKFGHDAGKFIDYATNPENIDEMRKYGLAPPPPPDPTPQKVEVVNLQTTEEKPS